MKKIFLIILAVLVVAGLYFWSTYNRLITGNEIVETQWAQVGTQYQRRFDLIPNLVESVKGAMQQEKEVFKAIAEARTRYSGALTTNEKAMAATQVESALGRLLVVMENYPQLKSIETVQTLMVQLEGTENRIGAERGRYNEKVRDYNLLVKRFPARFVAALMDFEERSYFEATSGAENAPKVEF